MGLHNNVKCIVMFSGGLDSVIATHLLIQQGLDVTALHFVLPFQSGIGLRHQTVRGYAERLGVPLEIVEEGGEFLEMVNNPSFGYGKNANPCVDCRIHRLEKAAAIMRERGASFVATGEVVGQRPMSQRRECLDTVIRKSGLEGYLLRPLSAQLLPPTVPEEKGWVDRSKLLGIKGRGRKDQFAYAKLHGLAHASPGGGCLLTERETGRRFNDLRSHEPEFSLGDFKLLAFGRHFRLGDRVRLVIGRTYSENLYLEKLTGSEDFRIIMADTPGPTGIVRGPATDEDLKTAASLVARYSKEREQSEVRVRLEDAARKTTVYTVVPASEELCTALRI